MAGVTRRRVGWRRARWERSYNAGLVSVVVVVLGVFGVWRAIDPPARVVERVPATVGLDRPAEAFARRFAAAYLAYDADRPELRVAALEGFALDAQASDLGFRPPLAGARAVTATEVVQAFRLPRDRAQYVIGADTDRDGRLYLSVTVGRHHDGALGVVGYPALVGPPPAGGVLEPLRAGELQDPAVETVVRRGLENFLAGSESNLRADLAPRAVVSLPGVELELRDVEELVWTPGRRAVLATVRARDARGGEMTLTYELAVRREGGRWLIDGIQTLPTAR